MIDISFLRQLDRFSLITRKNVTSSYAGERKSPRIGRGMIYKDYAIYSPEEDFKAIDWKVYARTDKLYVKRYEEERNLTVHILIDTSGSMNFGTKFKKHEYASMIGLGYAHVAMKNNERFVLSTFSERLDRFKPRKGRKQLMAMLNYLNKKKPEGKTKFSSALLKYEKRIKTRSLIVIISDFLIEPKEFELVIAAYRGHDVRVIQVLDAAEEGLDPYEGEYKLEDLEEGTVMKTHLSPLLKRKYNEMLTAHRSELKRIADEHKVKFFHCDTGKPIFDTFFDLLMQV